MSVSNPEFFTRENLEAQSYEDLADGFRDAYKDIYNVRPTGDWFKEDLVRFWMSFPADIERAIAEQEEYDAYAFEKASEEFGVEITSWRQWEEAYHADFFKKAEEQDKQLQDMKTARDNYNRRFSTTAAIEDYLDGVN